MKNSKDIFEGFYRKKFSLKEFIKEHINGILGTLIFHLFILLVFLFTRIQSYQEIQELNLMLEYYEEPEVEQTEEETREEFIERVFEQQMRASNQAVNVSRLEEEISTESYVEEVMKELNKERSEEWLQQQQELEEVLSAEDRVPVEKEEEKEDNEQEFRGPTTINYLFSSAPTDRQKLYLPVPVYKCRGYGIVEVAIEVNPQGEVTRVKGKVLEASEDPDCLLDVAERYAGRARFRADASAPSSHQGIITYTFMAQ